MSKATSIKGFMTSEGEAKYDFQALDNMPEALKKVPTAEVGQILYVESVDENGNILSVSAKNFESDPSESTNGMPSGGKAGQILCKKSDKDFDAEWQDLTIPEQYGLISYNQDKTITIT